MTLWGWCVEEGESLVLLEIPAFAGMTYRQSRSERNGCRFKRLPRFARNDD